MNELIIYKVMKNIGINIETLTVFFVIKQFIRIINAITNKITTGNKNALIPKEHTTVFLNKSL
jgi:hypothetical protein